MNNYDEYKNISVEECLSKCTADIRCKAISYMHKDRKGWSVHDHCYMYASSKPDSSSVGETYFTSYIRL